MLAGGLGTRMLPHTAERPKALLPVAGRPFAEHQVELLAANGVRDIVFSIAYKGDMIREALGDGARWDVRIRYVDEGDDRRGTGGAVRLFAESGMADDSFAVLYGDSYLPMPYAPVWRAYADSGAPALMTVLENADRWDTSNARLEPDGRVRYRKGEHTLGRLTHIDYGLSVLATATVIDRIPARHGDRPGRDVRARWATRACWRATRCTSGSTRSARRAASRISNAFSPARTGARHP